MWYMHRPDYVLKILTHRLLRDFEIQTNLLISARWLNLVIVNKKIEYEVDTLSFQTFFCMGTFIDSTHMKL